MEKEHNADENKQTLDNGKEQRWMNMKHHLMLWHKYRHKKGGNSDARSNKVNGFFRGQVWEKANAKQRTPRYEIS